jgi:hypothetical protein
MHGDDDQIVPYADSAPLSAKLLRNNTLKTYTGLPHGMPTTNPDQINSDLIAFLKDQRIGVGTAFLYFRTPNDASRHISLRIIPAARLLSSSVAVGTTIADRPPHRAVRAALPVG